MGGRSAKNRPQAPARFDLPPNVAALLGAEATDLLNALQGPSPVSVRYNPRKSASVTGDPVPWCTHGRYLAERPVFTLDPLLHAGVYYVQEASSMLVEQAFRATGRSAGTLLALDLCAAPGGKSTHLASLLSTDSLLVANEPVPKRHAALAENVWKHGAANTFLTRARPNDLSPLGELFDLVLVDAPCSGEGMFRKDPFAREQWNERLVHQCSTEQRNILQHAWQALRPGGHLIYSTCTWEPAENEEQVKALMLQGALPVPIPVDPSWGVVEGDIGLRCYPHRVVGEGFFIALLQKPGTWEPHVMHSPAGDHHAPVSTWCRHADRTDLHVHEDTVYATPSTWRAAVQALRGLPCISPGVPVAALKANEWRPHAALALNERLERAAFTEVAVDVTDALRYLRGEALPASGEASGTGLISYHGHALGWVNGARDRWNNGWPKPWRIRLR